METTGLLCSVFEAPLAMLFSLGAPHVTGSVMPTTVCTLGELCNALATCAGLKETRTLYTFFLKVTIFSFVLEVLAAKALYHFISYLIVLNSY